MNAVELLGELRERDARLTVQGNRLSLDAPRGALSDELLLSLREQKETLLQIVWRAEAMRRQLAPGEAIPLLVARETPALAGYCVSCGDRVRPDNPGRCGLCVTAAVWVLQLTPSGANEER